MSNNLDFNTAIKKMREVNADMLQLIAQLRDFLTTDKELEFSLGNESIFIKGLLSLMDNYRNGKFQSVTIGTEPDAVVLSMDGEGNLKVTDTAGNLVGVMCTGISFSDIADTAIDKATITDCTVDSLKGSVKVSGGKVSLETLKIEGNFVAQTAVVNSIDSNSAEIDDAYVRQLYIQGDRRMAFKDTRDVFAYNTSPGVTDPVDDFASKLSGGYNLSDMVWDWDSSTAKPSMLGIDPTDNTIPSLITICGNNKYEDFRSTLPPVQYGISNVKVDFVDPSVIAVVLTNEYADMASVFLWPSLRYETVSYGGVAKNIVVHEFSSTDVGKEVYYRTSASPWVIYRTLTVHYNNMAPISATLGTPYTIPAYSCVKFIVGRTGTASDGSTMSILEIG